MTFTTGEIISAGTGRLCCPIERMYVIYDFLTGDKLFTHQLPRAFRACEEWVKQQCPWVRELNEKDCTTDNWREWLAAAESKYGPTHELLPLPTGQWKACDPVAEAIELMEDKNKVIAIQL